MFIFLFSTFQSMFYYSYNLKNIKNYDNESDL